MKEWFESRKLLMIFLGIVYIILALFVVSAYVRNVMDYRKGLYIDNSEEDIISQYMERANNDEAEAKKLAIRELK